MLWETWVKLLLMVALGAYWAAQDSFLLAKWRDPALAYSYDHNPCNQDQTPQILIAGGSNALIGLSAEWLRDQGLAAINCSISSLEGAGLFDYPTWLANKPARAELVIYSSMNFWLLHRDAPFQSLPIGNWQRSQGNPKTLPLASLLRLYMSKSTISFNRFGDGLPQVCESTITPPPRYLTDLQQLDEGFFDSYIAGIVALSQTKQSGRVVVRIPPFYVAPEDAALFRRYAETIAARIEARHIVVLGLTDAVTTDPDVMCFGPNHPKLAYAQNFTQTLLQESRTHGFLH